jgi:hypothetical protein
VCGDAGCARGSALDVSAGDRERLMRRRGWCQKARAAVRAGRRCSTCSRANALCSMRRFELVPGSGLSLQAAREGLLPASVATAVAAEKERPAESKETAGRRHRARKRQRYPPHPAIECRVDRRRPQAQRGPIAGMPTGQGRKGIVARWNRHPDRDRRRMHV